MIRWIALILISLHSVSAAAEILIQNAWYRIPFPGASVTAAYVTIQNSDEHDDELLSVSSKLCDTIEIHDMIADAYGMQMKHLTSLKIPARSSVSLKPSGKHLMFIKPQKAAQTGMSGALHFKFKRAGTVTIQIKGRRD